MKVNCTTLLVAAAAAAIAPLAAAQCPNPDHDCCTAGTVGCSDVDCCTAVCAADPFCCNNSWDSVCVGEAETICGLDCGGGGNPACPGIGDCCDVNATTGCSDEACCNAVCAVDPFCCNTSWDLTCAGEAVTICGLDCGGGSTCCVAQGTPGCDDPTCQDAVCALDAFCCTTQWDQLCVNSANNICEVCGGGGPIPNCPSEGDCCIETGLPGCNDEACCTAVCTADPFCCETAWDAICAGSAVGLCGCVVTCPISDHDCYTQGIPGCTDEACCALVCGADSFCCQTAWDGLCVDAAFAFCGVPECPFECTGTDEGEPCGSDTNGGCNVAQGGTSNCCVANGGLGCDDPTCQDAVCGIDPFCCETSWDGICASEATTFCPDICFTLPPQFGVINCGETICGTAWADGNFRDTDWYVLDLSGFGGTGVEVTVSISNQIPMVIGIINSTDCATANALNPFATSGYCGSTSFTVCLAPTVHWVFAAPNSFTGFPCTSGVNGYALTVDCGAECAPLGCGNAGHDCFTAGGPFCDDADCCNTVCSFDPFCCQTAWDTICVDEALQFCGAPKCPFECTGTDEGEKCGTDSNGGCNVAQGGTSNCCVANGGLGCDDPTCQAAVCGADPFCCDTSWDGICAGAAATLCPDICFTGEPSFGAIACNETVCGTAWADGNIRDTDWYILNLGAETEITVSISNQLPMVIGIVDTTDCSTASALNPFATSGFCGTASFTVTLPAGVHWVFAGPNTFNGFPCTSGANGYALTVSCPITCVENPDQSGDGCVNGTDITFVLGNWNPAGGGTIGGPGDVNCDGFVDGFDLSLILGAWLTGPNCP